MGVQTKGSWDFVNFRASGCFQKTQEGATEPMSQGVYRCLVSVAMSSA